MYDSVGALRYLDPTWNKVQPGKRLYPSLFYLLGISDYGSDSVEAAEKIADRGETTADI